NLARGHQENHMKEHWILDPNVAFVNHGSFGATPRAVLAVESALREEMEREPVGVLARQTEPHPDAERAALSSAPRECEPRLHGARAALAESVGAEAEDIAFVPNATTGVNSVLRS